MTLEIRKSSTESLPGAFNDQQATSNTKRCSLEKKVEQASKSLYIPLDEAQLQQIERSDKPSPLRRFISAAGDALSPRKAKSRDGGESIQESIDDSLRLERSVRDSRTRSLSLKSFLPVGSPRSSGSAPEIKRSPRGRTFSDSSVFTIHHGGDEKQIKLHDLEVYTPRRWQELFSSIPMNILTKILARKDSIADNCFSSMSEEFKISWILYLYDESRECVDEVEKIFRHHFPENGFAPLLIQIFENDLLKTKGSRLSFLSNLSVYELAFVAKFCTGDELRQMAVKCKKYEHAEIYFWLMDNAQCEEFFQEIQDPCAFNFPEIINAYLRENPFVVELAIKKGWEKDPKDLVTAFKRGPLSLINVKQTKPAEIPELRAFTQMLEPKHWAEIIPEISQLHLRYLRRRGYLDAIVEIRSVTYMSPESYGQVIKENKLSPNLVDHPQLLFLLEFLSRNQWIVSHQLSHILEASEQLEERNEELEILHITVNEENKKMRRELRKVKKAANMHSKNALLLKKEVADLKTDLAEMKVLFLDRLEKLTTKLV